MKPRPFFIFLFIGIIGGGMIAWRYARNTQEMASKLLSLEERRTQLSKSLAGATARLAIASQMTTDLRSRLQPFSAPSAEKKISTSAANRMSRLIDDNPTLQNLQSAARRAQLAITYGPFYRMLALSAAQIEKFSQNLLRREEQHADLNAAATEQGLSAWRDPAFKKLSAQVETDYVNAQRELLGLAGEQQLRNYERVSLVRETVSGIAGAAAMAGTPLDAAQAEQLTRTLAAASRDDQGNGLALPQSIDWGIVHQQAKTFLSDSQLTFIETTEPRGPRGSGGRFLPQLNATIDAAAREESQTAKLSPPSTARSTP